MFPQQSQYDGKIPNFMEMNEKNTDNRKKSGKGLFALLKSPFEIIIPWNIHLTPSWRIGETSFRYRGYLQITNYQS